MAKRSLKIQEQYKKKVNSAFIGLGLTQKKFAEARLGLSRSTVSNFLRGKPVSRENFINICCSLKLDWQEIAGLTAEEKIDDLDQTKIQPTTQLETSPSVDIDTLVIKLREQVKADIETRCGIMRILDMSQPVGLDDIYTKVNILEKISGRRRKDVAELIDNCELEFNRFNFGQVKEKIPGKEAVSKYRTLLILGKPGAGKTTFLKHLVIQCSRDKFQGDLVPFFITLKEFAEAEEQPQLLDYLYKYTSGKNKKDLDLVLKQGKALICLDGLDEVLAQDSPRVVREIENFTNDYPQNQYLMTCRIAAKEYTFKRFTEVEIADFDWSQITIFANNWFQDKPIKPERFLDRLKNDEPIQELASNPLLLTLLCLAFEESGDFPGNRAGLYKEGLDALLKKWDAKRGIQRDNVYHKLWTQRKEDLLSKVAWDTFEPGEYFFKQDKVERYIGEYIRNLPGANTDEDALQLDSEAVLKSIESQHGLLVERAKQIYSFSHLTFQEYFTAREIIIVRQSSDAALQELVSHLFDRRWREIFLLAVAMSPNADRLVLLMKEKIDTLVAKSVKIQQLLQWLDNKTKLDNISFSAINTEIVQCISEYYVCNNHALYKSFHLIFIYNQIIYFVIEDNPRLQLYIELYLALNRCAILYIDPVDMLLKDMSLYRTIDNLIKISQLIDSKFCNILKNLKTRLPIQLNITAEDCRRWWRKYSKDWIKDFKNFTIQYQNLGHNWQFDYEQKKLLSQYNDANKLLTQCLHQDCYISREVRQKIEETLLVPYAKIKRRKQI